MTIKHKTALLAIRRKWLRQYANQDPQSPDMDLHKLLFDSVCPRCGKQHQVYLNWTGRGTPRIYCELCKPAVGSINTSASDPIASGIYQAGKRQVCPRAE